MKLIVGLGNPSEKYKDTRHNVGFMVIDKLVNKLKIKFLEKRKLSSYITQFFSHGNKYIIIKPNAFMNLSGNAVRKVSDFYKIKDKDICIISDDVDLPIGIIRIRKEGSSGGHNGLESIIKNLNSDKFTRIRIGIAPLQGLPAEAEKFNRINTKEFVLENFNKSELKIINRVILKVLNILLDYLNNKKLISHTYNL